jgi:hypothetical protein
MLAGSTDANKAVIIIHSTVAHPGIHVIPSAQSRALESVQGTGVTLRPGRWFQSTLICDDVSGCQQRSHRARSPPENEGLVMIILLRELAGLFVDDGALALAILAVVGLAGMAAVLMPNAPLASVV